MLPTEGNGRTVNLGVFIRQVAFAMMANCPDEIPAKVDRDISNASLSALGASKVDRLNKGEWDVADCEDLRDLELNCTGSMDLQYPGFTYKKIRAWGENEMTFRLQEHIHNIVVAMCAPAGIIAEVGLEQAMDGYGRSDLIVTVTMPDATERCWVIEMKSILCTLWSGWEGLERGTFSNRKLFGLFKQVRTMKRSGR